MSSSQKLRQLLKQKSNQVNHPLAKYNSLGQLVCAICNSSVKNEIVWSSHLLSKKHKDNVQDLKLPKSKAIVPVPKPKSKQYVLCDEEPPFKKPRLPSDFFDDTHTSKANVVRKSILKNPLKTLPVIQKPPQTPCTPPSSTPFSTVDSTADPHANDKSHSALPANFFDKPLNTKTEIKESESIETSEKKTVETVLPEGFFDDPKKDAKARNVEYIDPKEKEWEDFKKIIQEETKIAENLQEEDDEESEITKDMSEYNKMKTCLTRVERMKELVQTNTNVKDDGRSSTVLLNYEKQSTSKPINNKNSTSKAVIDESSQSSDSSADTDDEDMDSCFDWRAKMA